MKYKHAARKRNRTALAVLFLTGSLSVINGQSAAPVILEVDLENYVQYWDDVADPTKLATVPSQSTASARVFMQNVWVADVVSVNGQAARGTFVSRTQSFSYRPLPAPGQNIADINRNGGPSIEVFEILLPDGTMVGALMSMGLVAGPAPPGSPEGMMFSNSAIVGGTGAFLGARGQCGIASSSGVRNASQSEDPSLRRSIGGGKMKMLLHVIPAFRPEVMSSAGAPAVVHSADFSLVTATAPANAGEVLSVFAKGLGPTRTQVAPGRSFPAEPLASCNGPVQVIINGMAAKVIAAVGYPGATDAYQVNFRVPANVASGTATLHISTAWIASPAITIQVR